MPEAAGERYISNIVESSDLAAFLATLPQLRKVSSSSLYCLLEFIRLFPLVPPVVRFLAIG